MQVKSIAECSKGSILKYFRPSLSYHLSLSIFEWVFYTGFTVYNLYIKISPSFENRRDQLEPWWVPMPFFYYFIIACGLILNVRVYLATFSVSSMPGILAVICDFQQCGVLKRSPFAASFQAKKHQIKFGQRLANALIRLHVCMCKLI